MIQMQEELITAYKTTTKRLEQKDIFTVSFINGPRITIVGHSKKSYKINFINKQSGIIIYETIIKAGQWSEAMPKWLIPWHIKAFDVETNELVYEHIFSLKNKIVAIDFGSKSIGDGLSWMPYVDDFQKRYQCKVLCATHNNAWFEEKYPNITFMDKGSLFTGLDVYAHFAIGWFYNKESTNFDFTCAPRDCRTIPLGQVAADILHVPYVEKKPKVSWGTNIRPLAEKYICIGPHSTSACKLWPTENWQKVVDYALSKDLKIVYLGPPNIHKDKVFPLKNVIPIMGRPLKEVAEYLQHAEIFVGLGSGLSWMSWVMDTHTVMIAGFSQTFFEFQSNISRPYPKSSDVCTGCFNDITHVFDRKNWLWCPRHQKDSRQFECQKLITPQMVINAIAKKLDE